MIYQTVYIGGNWSYVQRYTSVANEKNAKKVAYLFAGLYLISPVLWMLPPMIFRVINPNLQGLEPEAACMLLCQKVLPAGLIGLVLSGMISATSSKANTTINLAATVFAQDVYRKLVRPEASEKEQILIARLFTLLFGAGTIVVAILVPRAGGIVEVVLSIASIAGSALFAPIIWSLYSKRQNAFSVVFVTVASLSVNLFLKSIAPSLLGIKLDRTAEKILGVGLPLFLLLVFEWYNKFAAKPAYIFVYPVKEDHLNKSTTSQHTAASQQNKFGVTVIGWSIAFIGLGILLLGFFSEGQQLVKWIRLAIAILGTFVCYLAKGMRS